MNAGSPSTINEKQVPATFARWPAESTTAPNRHDYVTDYDDNFPASMSPESIQVIRESIQGDLVPFQQDPEQHLKQGESNSLNNQGFDIAG